MTAAWLWARAELRARWRSWVVLGLLAGATAGIVAAGIAGARRTDSSLPRYIAVAGSIDAAVLANDPTFDAKQRAAVAALPEVRQTFPFEVAVLANVMKPRGLDGTLFPLTAATARLSEPVIVEGRHTNPKNPNEAVIDQNIARQFKLGIGSTIVIHQFVPATIPSDAPPGLVPPGAKTFQEQLRVVGITKATSSDKSWSPSSGLWAKHGKEVVGLTNMFVRLRHGQADFLRFQRDVQRLVGHPVNVASANDLLGLRKIRNIMGVERDGLLLFALAALLGGGVLVGQALVRAVTASGADAETWRAMGADRPIAVQGMVLPSLLTAAVAAVTAIAVGIALSPRFPIGVARRYELDVGIHADALVLGLAVLVLVLVTIAIAVAAAWWRVTRGEATRPATSRAARWATNAGFPPAMVIGSRLAVEPGRGRRAVPVRSALIGAVVGVLGVVGCFTFRAGIADAASNPKRSGVVWNYEVASGAAPIAVHDRAGMAGDPAVGSALRALWSRAVPINGVATPTFGIATVRGRLPLVVLSGHAPRNASELALAPSTQRSLQLHVGDTVRVGKAPGRTVHVVGTAFLPSSSHTGYDESGWMTLAGLRAAVGPDAFAKRPDDFEDYLLLRWRPGANVAAAERRISKVAAAHGYFSQRATLPTSVVDLGHLGSVPLVLAVFFALLAAATVAHALVTTVRRRRFDLAVLRSMGFTRRQSRFAIAWQATLLAAIGLLVGVPLGLVMGRVVWRWVADLYPVAYVTPVAVVAVLVVVPVALLVAQALAAGPAHAATRIRPAQTLRAE